MEYIPYEKVLNQIETIQKGDIIYIISDILELAKICRRNAERFDIQRFLNTITEKVGEEGTILVPTFNWDFCNGKPFDYRYAPGKTGALGNAALKNKKFKRTKHPIYSFAVWGKRQKEITSIDLDDSFGEGTIFDFLYNNRAKALVIGLDALDGFTMFHYVEQKVGVWYRYFKEFEGIYIDENGVSQTKKVKMYVRDLKINPQEDVAHLSQILEDLNVSNSQVINGVPFRTVLIEQACHIVQMDIELNGSRNLYQF